MKYACYLYLLSVQSILTFLEVRFCGLRLLPMFSVQSILTFCDTLWFFLTLTPLPYVYRYYIYMSRLIVYTNHFWFWCSLNGRSRTRLVQVVTACFEVCTSSWSFETSLIPHRYSCGLTIVLFSYCLLPFQRSASVDYGWYLYVDLPISDIVAF